MEKMEDKKNVYDLGGEEYVNKLSSKLKEMEEFSMPEWAFYVKTSMVKERPPMSSDWWYVRAASILRQVYLKGTVGVGKLSTRYGGKMDRGMQPPKFFKGSRKIIRVILQQAEKAGFREKMKEPKHGRRFTKIGKKFMDEAAQ